MRRLPPRSTRTYPLCPCPALFRSLVKRAEARGAGLPETMFFRQAGAVPLVLAWIAVRPGLASIRTQRIGAHLTRTIVGLMGMVCTFGAVLLLPLAEADRKSTRLNSSH